MTIKEPPRHKKLSMSHGIYTRRFTHGVTWYIRYYSGGHPYYIYHSPSYGRGLAVGSLLPAGGSRFAYNDKSARSSFGLPSTGKIGNGTVKTSVVGKGGSGSKSSGSHKSGGS